MVFFYMILLGNKRPSIQINAHEQPLPMPHASEKSLNTKNLEFSTNRSWVVRHAKKGTRNALRCVDICKDIVENQALIAHDSH